MVKLNRHQTIALYRLWQRDGQSMTYPAFRRTAQPGWDCIMVKWCGMWIGIEADGYTHS